MGRVAQRIEEWKRKIVDLSRRNRLLFFARTRGSTLKIIEPTLLQIFDRLVNSEEAWQFFMPPDATGASETGKGSRPEQPSPNLTRSGRGHEIAEETGSRPRRLDRHANEVLTDIEDGAQLRSVLRNLHRRSRTDFEERGVRILFLSFGVLKWSEVEQSEVIKSPILLVPVELTRDSVNDPFELCPVDEEIVINPALAVKLGDDFKVELPAVPEDWNSVPLEKFLADVQKTTKKYGWSVEQECWLGLFSFHKLVIYHDLKNHAGLLEAHSVVRCLCEEEQLSVTVDPPDPRDLDKKTSPDTSLLVADADSSQLVCIETVKAGSNLVIQGPPGTGKSQTITNLISEFIAGGKSVLFVSEKMAALEVVFRRLQKANLVHFCLQLHSHRAKKREVIQELYKSFTEQLQPKKGLTEFEAQQLVERRNKLNDYVHALHLIRRPLGYSAFEALGWVAELEETPYVPAGAQDASGMTPETLDTAQQLAYRLRSMWTVAVAGEAFPWFGCTLRAFTLQNKSNLQAILIECMKSLILLREAVSATAQHLAVEVPRTVTGADWVLETCSLLRQGPGIERQWILDSDLDDIAQEAGRYGGLSRTYHENRSALSSIYSSDFLFLPGDLRHRLKVSLEELSSHVGRPVEDDMGFVANRSSVQAWTRDFAVRLENWLRDGETLQQSLGLAGNLSLRRARQLIRIAEICEAEERPDESWFQVTKLREVAESLPSIREDFEKSGRDRRSLLAEYDPRILELDTKSLVEKFLGPYSSFFRFFRPGYYRARSQVRGLRKSGKLPDSILAELRRVQGVKDWEAYLVASFPRYKELFGVSFRGFDMDFGRISRALSGAQELVELAGVQPIPNQLVRQASAQGIATQELRNAANCLKQSLDEHERNVSTVKQYLPSDFWDGSALPMEERSLSDLKAWSRQMGDVVERVCELTGRVLSCAHSGEHLTWHGVIADLDRLSELRKIESQVAASSEHLKERFGARFDGLQTSWDQVLEAVQWATRFRSHMGTRPIPDALVSLAVGGKEKAPESESLKDALVRMRTSRQRLAQNFVEGYPAVGGIPLSQLDFDSIERRLRDLVNEIDSLRDWVDFKTLEADFGDRGFRELFTNLVSRAPLLRGDDVPKGVRRALLQAWLNWVFAQDSSLGAFRGENHDRLIAEFRELDRKHWEQGVHRVIREANRHRPAASVVIPGGEVQVLFREANKQRRHLPLRRLFGLIPNLLTQLKPCLLMSPISVSQFLDPEKTRFDLVIFDEASQLRSEDAICSVYRGKQLAVCGDNRQLPPTAFFEQGMSEELPEETEDPNVSPAFDVFDSVLDACAAAMPQRQLKWHYRSEHESLIAFSNCTFYDYDLITFPSWLHEDEGLGVKFVHVPDGVYDRGGRKDNVREAERVVSLIEEHLRRFPKQSLGVVTFNIAQADTIENYLEYFRRQNPELERYFAPDLLEKFFVKNLESVQGDERDVLIFSVGYGKDRFGRLTMNFGPLNSAGGERRLNVAVTRARKKVIVVSSIRASDFDLGEIRAEGVRVLHKYLDFAERGQEALELRAGEGEYESPLEQSVAATIRSFGFAAVPQVGCSSFRVDLGVVDPSQPGRFLLGVECDGASYHSSATARDRDRIRQQVLERLGWRIHRIWSPDWVTRREAEVRRLRDAIESAQNARSSDISSSPPHTSNSPVTVEPPNIVEKIPPQINDKWIVPDLGCKVPSLQTTDDDDAGPPISRRWRVAGTQENVVSNS